MSMFDKKTVLIIDDSETIRTYLKNILTPKGAAVDGAATGRDGLAMCVHHQYDLILLDLIMPDMDGIEVLKRIRGTNDTSTIVMITGHGGIKSAIAASQLGADGYIQKQDITTTIRDHIEFLYALEQAIDHRAGLVAQKELEQVRSDFYSMVTHDLRNPTTLMLMAVDTLTDDSATPLTDRQHELVSLIKQAAGRLLFLINDYLDFAQLDAGHLRLDLGKCDVNQIVESSARLIRFQAQAKQQTLTLDLPTSPVMVSADAERLRQVFDNLLSNAVKYTPEGGHIALKLRVENEQIIFHVSDTGMGIAPEHIPMLFTKYFRVPGDNKRRILGTGLGLVIVKEIIEAHGGSIRAESEGVANKGTTFIVNIPLKNAPAPIDNAETTSRDSMPEKPSFTPDSVEAGLVQTFVKETKQHVHLLHDGLRKLRQNPEDTQSATAVQRIAHTLKGNAGAMQLTAIFDLATQIDDILCKVNNHELILTSIHMTNLDQLVDQITLELTRMENNS